MSRHASTATPLAFVTAVLFFVRIVLHELAHATGARFSGVPVRGITLIALGGIALIEKDAATPAKEFWMAIAGMLLRLSQDEHVIGLITPDDVKHVEKDRWEQTTVSQAMRPHPIAALGQAGRLSW